MQWNCPIFIFTHHYLDICPTHPTKSYYISSVHTNDVYIIYGIQHPYSLCFLQLSRDDILLSYCTISFKGQLIMTMPDRY